jgi:hypothetical protein
MPAKNPQKVTLIRSVEPSHVSDHFYSIVESPISIYFTYSYL